MKNEEIYKARKRYNKYLSETKKLLRLKNELEELKNNHIVKRYLELKPIESKDIISEKAMVSYSFALCNIDSQNSSKKEKIYVYMGAYRCDNSYDSRSDIKLSDKERECADYLLYTNIDSSFDSVTISPKSCEQFESKYTVLKFNNTLNIKEKYYDLQHFYFSQLLSINLRKKGIVLTLLREKIKQ